VRSEFLAFSPPCIGEDEIAEVVSTLRSGWITTGPRVRRFEESFAERLGADGALAVSSCTDAMQVALASLGVGPGDAVFTTTMTFSATAHVVEHLGAVPVLVDVDSDTLNIDCNALEAAIEATIADGALTPRAMIPVHFAGHPVDMAGVLSIAERFGLAVVEDAAHALPASWNNTLVGDVGDGSVERAVAFSFYATKNLTTGEGGMLTATPALLEEARLWSLHGMSRDAWNRYGKGGSWRYDIVRPGFKCNMTDMMAALGLVQLSRLDDFQKRRQSVVERYDEALSGSELLQTPTVRPGVDPAWHLYVLRLELDRLSIDRTRFIEELAARNIGSSVHFIPLHEMSFYRDKYSLSPAQFPVAAEEFERIVSLPLHPGLTDADVDDVIEAVLDVVGTHRR
jgi:dTDP-4-amino-4,6-dideoxygalactose transaminase